jgi:hypothetical protein
MTNRITYDKVEELAMRARRDGHDVKLYFNFEGKLHVFHDGEQVLVDPGRSYVVAEAKVRQILMNADPKLEPSATVTDKDVQRGRKTRKPPKKKPPTAKQVQAAKRKAPAKKGAKRAK